MTAVLAPFLTLTNEVILLAGCLLINSQGAIIYLQKNPGESTFSAAKRAVKATGDATKQGVEGVCTWIYQHPVKTSQVVGYYGAPVIAPYFAGSMMAAIGIVPLAPAATILASSFVKFRMRQITAGTFYALLQSAGLGGVAAQVMSVAGFLSLSGMGPNGQQVQEWLISTAYSLGGFRAPLIGIGVSILGTLMGSIATIPHVYLARSAISSVPVLSLIALWAELRSLALFSLLRWMKDRAFKKLQHCISQLQLMEEWCSGMPSFASIFFKGCSLLLKGLESNWRHLIHVAKLAERRHVPPKYGMKTQRIEEDLNEWEILAADGEDETSVLSLAPETRSPPAPLLVQQDDDVESIFINWDHVHRGGLASHGAFSESPSTVSNFIDCNFGSNHETLHLFDGEDEAIGSVASPSDEYDQLVVGNIKEDYCEFPTLTSELYEDHEIWASA